MRCPARVVSMYVLSEEKMSGNVCRNAGIFKRLQRALVKLSVSVTKRNLSLISRLNLEKNSVYLCFHPGPYRTKFEFQKKTEFSKPKLLFVIDVTLNLNLSNHFSSHLNNICNNIYITKSRLINFCSCY